MGGNTSNRSALRIITRGKEAPSTKLFCGHCGKTPHPGAQPEDSRVCQACGLGLVLEAETNIAPGIRDPFLVVDHSLAVCALSRESEKLLGIVETDAVHRHISDFLSPGDAEQGSDALRSALALAARGDSVVQNLIVRPRHTFGVRYWARIGHCGPPSAALLVLADAR